VDPIGTILHGKILENHEKMRIIHDNPVKMVMKIMKN
jgi:hypothetical protein